MGRRVYECAGGRLRSILRPNVRAKATEEAGADWPRKDDTHWAWSGQAVAAVAGRRLERGVRPHSAMPAWLPKCVRRTVYFDQCSVSVPAEARVFWTERRSREPGFTRRSAVRKHTTLLLSCSPSRLPAADLCCVEDCHSMASPQPLRFPGQELSIQAVCRTR